MKYIKCLLLCVFVLACGAPAETPEGYTVNDDGVEVFGHEEFHSAYESEVPHEGEPWPVWDMQPSTVNKIYMPANYGSETSQAQCIPPWAGGECQVPDQRTTSIRVITGTSDSNCDGANLGLAVDDAILYLQTQANAQGWTVTRKANNASSANITIRCTGDNQPAGVPGSTFGSVFDCHSTGNGSLCQFAQADIYLRMGVVQANTFYQNSATNAQKKAFLRNILAHELAHAFGFGHITTTDYTKLTNSGMPSSPLAGANNDGWDMYLQLSSIYEIPMLDCYNESSGTNKLCP